MYSKTLLLLGLPSLVAAATYDISKNYEGDSFFKDWNFYNKFDDLTNGNAIFMSKSGGKAAKLAYVEPSTGHAIMRVDNTSTVGFSGKRNTIRMETKDRFTIGSLWITDMVHAPYGCSVWPAFWSSSPNWPAGGEIDTFEGVNNVQMNQMGLHTAAGCSQVNPKQTTTLVNATNCDINANLNQGCIVTNPTEKSYGKGFAAAGGGVFVTEFAEEGISIWFYSRADIPQTLLSNDSTIDTSALGTPTGNWPSTGCDVGKFFEPQHLIFTMTLCGDFAGPPAEFSKTCPGVCYQDYVVGNGAVYNTAYFEVKHVRVYGKQGVNNVIFGPSTDAGVKVSLSLSTAVVFGAAMLVGWGMDLL